MAKKPVFPVTVRAGATAIKIYRNPLMTSTLPAGAEQNGDARVTGKSYDSYLVAYYRGGKRTRSRFNTLEDARTEADRVRALVLNEDLTALDLKGNDRLIYARASETAKAIGASLDILVEQAAEAKKILGSVGLIEAARFYDRYGKTVTQIKTIPQIVEELTTGLEADKKSDYHLRDMECRLRAFALAFPGPIMEVQTKQLTDWLRTVKGKNKKGDEVVLAPKTRNHYRNAVIQLFNFARDNGYLPKGMPTEAEAVKALDVVTSENEIFTIAEMITLLAKAPDYLRVPMVIKAFSGVRTEEMVDMKWEHVKFEQKSIILTSDVTKTSQRRIIPISDNLMAWLESYKKETGRICSRWSRPQALFQAFDRHGKRLGINVGANKFRNSYISYRVAVTHDVQRVSLESGNSPKVIQKEYLELATEDDGKKWFGIMLAKEG
jgi:integrase